jgi:hypothetical protein
MRAMVNGSVQIVGFKGRMAEMPKPLMARNQGLSAAVIVLWGRSFGHQFQDREKLGGNIEIGLIAGLIKGDGNLAAQPTTAEGRLGGRVISS